MVYRDSKDLARITASDKVLSDKAFSIEKKHQNMMYINAKLLQ